MPPNGVAPASGTPVQAALASAPALDATLLPAVVVFAAAAAAAAVVVVVAFFCEKPAPKWQLGIVV